MNQVARLFTYLFHPLLMPSYLVGLLMLLLPNVLSPLRYEVFQGFLMLIFLVTFILPAINLVIFKLFGTLPSLTMEERQHRVVPFLFITILYLLMTYLFHSKFSIGWNENMMKFLLIIDSLVLVATLITLFYKISVHSLAICGFVGVILPLNKVADSGTLLYPTIGLILVAGMVMAARMQLQAHTAQEVMRGGLVGFAIGFAGMAFFF